jgi:hypothetical protein
MDRGRLSGVLIDTSSAGPGGHRAPAAPGAHPLQVAAGHPLQVAAGHPLQVAAGHLLQVMPVQSDEHLFETTPRVRPSIE